MTSLPHIEVEGDKWIVFDGENRYSFTTMYEAITFAKILAKKTREDDSPVFP